MTPQCAGGGPPERQVCSIFPMALARRIAKHRGLPPLSLTSVRQTPWRCIQGGVKSSAMCGFPNAWVTRWAMSSRSCPVSASERRGSGMTPVRARRFEVTCILASLTREVPVTSNGRHFLSGCLWSAQNRTCSAASSCPKWRSFACLAGSTRCHVADDIRTSILWKDDECFSNYQMARCRYVNVSGDLATVCSKQSLSACHATAARVYQQLAHSLAHMFLFTSATPSQN